MQIKSLNTDSFAKTQEFAVDFAKSLKPGDILCLYGDLGSGKTTFVQGLARGLNINRRIISPTFIIARHYEMGSGNFYHIDLYRVKTHADLLSFGLDDILSDPDNIVVIEWAEKLDTLLPKKRYELKFNIIEDDKRFIEINKYE